MRSCKDSPCAAALAREQDLRLTEAIDGNGKKR
jgi:hypothetical protein